MAPDTLNIRVPRDCGEHHRERKEALGVTWEQYLDGQAPPLVDALDDEALTDALADLLATEFDVREIEQAAYEGSREGAREALAEGGRL